MTQENNEKDAHDTEYDDVYDLYNACNGELHEGVLDIRKLDELSEEEREILDVSRLKKAWVHVTGCGKCARIIHTLNFARQVLRERSGKPPPNHTESTDSKHLDSQSDQEF
jgi:hypothetical protein